MNVGINKEFVFSYLSGKSTALQKQMIDEWMKDPAHEELFYKWLVEYEYLHPQYLTEVTEAIAYFHQLADRNERFPLPEQQILTRPSSSRRVAWGWLVAASVGLVMLGIYLGQDILLYKTYTSAYGQTETLLLSDSTRVVLNAHSTLRVPRFGFGKNSREVYLTGEANFDVTHQTNHQKFVVKTDKSLDVVVLGTEFTVYSRQQNARVVLNRGKVQLRYQDGDNLKEVIMKPGDLVTLDQNNHLSQQVTTQPENHAAWKDHRFVYEDTSLSEFARQMGEYYGLKIKIEDEVLAKRTLVGSYRAENSDELLEIVTGIFNIQAVRNGDTILLTHKP
jgi:transmembrane sensor